MTPSRERPRANQRSTPGWLPPRLDGKVALVAGATRGAGRAIAAALGECGATVYCTGRSVPGKPGIKGRPETIQETAQLVNERGGVGIAVRVDHTDVEAVRRLISKIQDEQARLDILVNDIWGGEALVEWGKSFWEHSLENGLFLLRQAIHTHIITSVLAAPLILRSKGIIVEITDGTNENNREYRENLYYDLCKVSVNRLAMGMAHELRPHGAAAIAVTPGFLRSEQMLEHFGVQEGNWRDAIKKDPYFAESETPNYVARAVAHLVADPASRRRSGDCFWAAEVARLYGFKDIDGRQPDFEAAMRTYQKERRTKEATTAR